jgi:hypothetical protein
MPMLSPDPADEADLPEDVTPGESPAAAEPAAAPVEEPGTRVSIKPPNRRAAAAEALNRRLEDLTGTVTSLRDGLSQRDRELSEMRGMLQGVSQRAYAAPQAPQAPAPDEHQLLKEAKAALDAKDFDTYHSKTIAASEARVMRSIGPALQEIANRQNAQQGGGMNPELMAMFAAHPDVASHPRHVELLAAKNVELDARGVPPGAGRIRQVFAEVDAIVKSGRKPNASGQRYSSSSAGALSGVPSSRGGAASGGGDMGVTLNAEENRVALKLERAGIMSRADYAKGLAEADPNRLQR